MDAIIERCKQGNVVSSEVLDKFAIALAQQLYHDLLDHASTIFAAIPNDVAKDLFETALVPIMLKLNPTRYLQLLGKVVLGQSVVTDSDVEFLTQNALPGVLDRPSSNEEEVKTARRPVFGQLKISDAANKADLVDARALFLALKAEALLKAGKLELAKDVMDELEVEVVKERAAISVPSLVFSCFYKARCLLFSATEKYHEYYIAGVNYLLHTPYDQIQFDPTEFAIKLGVAALITPEDFNFGELLELSVFTENPNRPWIYDLCFAFQEGKFELYDVAMAKHKAHIEAVPELRDRVSVLEEKFKVCVLLEYAFSQKSRQRIDLGTLKDKTRVEDVETLLINAMANGLLRGTIDAVANVFRCDWVKPRVLDRARLTMLKDRVSAWVSRENSVLLQMESLTPELLVS